MFFIDIVHASSEAASAAAEGAQEGLLASLGINVTLFLFQLANFIVVALILWFLILKPLTKKMAERQKIIDESLDNAKKIQTNLEQSEQDYQKHLQEAKRAGEKVLEQAGVESEKLSSELKDKAKKEIESLVAQAKRNIQLEKEEMTVAFKGEAATLVALALEKILSEKMTDERDKKFIKEIVEKLDK